MIIMLFDNVVDRLSIVSIVSVVSGMCVASVSVVQFFSLSFLKKFYKGATKRSEASSASGRSRRNSV